jgi:archaemetzincin
LLLLHLKKEVLLRSKYLKLIVPIFLAYFSFSGGLQDKEMKRKQSVVQLVPIGNIPQDLVSWLATSAEQVVPFQVKPGTSIEIPPKAYDPNRDQYRGERLLDSLNKLEDRKAERILGLIDVDCYAEGLNFIFGQASFSSRVAVVCLPRLHQSYYHLPEDAELFRERVLKEVIHELGHTWNLAHCPDPHCVMHFSNSLPDTDKKKHEFCELCQRRLKWK